jgi:hypothetical protein
MTSRRPLPGRPDVPLARLFFQRLIYESTRGSLGLPRRLCSELFPSPSLRLVSIRLPSLPYDIEIIPLNSLLLRVPSPRLLARFTFRSELYLA